MSLPTGARFGPYEVLSHLGSGGMGEVYRARDTRLDRDVALKVLRAEAAPTPAARERFEREARALSRLSHPHVCALFDVGRAEDTDFLVMELLDGETLAARLARGPLPLDQLRRYALQIAQALGAAHREGIVHRDLKPGNVMITASGVKLLDFGLAKAVDTRPPSPEAETAALLTADGTWMGTAPYMAPEALQGRPSDARGDVFALGAVLYEMATGARAFAGETAASVAAAVLQQDPPPLSALRPEVGPVFDRLVRECLVKDPSARWQSAHDAALQLAAADERAPGATVPPPRFRRTAWLGWAVAAAALVLAVSALLRPRSSPQELLDLEISPVGRGFSYAFDAVTFAVSPDGRQLAFVAVDAEGVRHVWLRSLTSIASKPLPNTEGASSLFWSPRGDAIAFFADGQLKRLDLSAAAAVPLCPVPPGAVFSGTWSTGGDILFAGAEGNAIYRTSTTGGPSTELIRPDSAQGEERVLFPHYLPDGQTFLYLLRLRDGQQWLMRTRIGQAPAKIGPMESNVAYLDSGHLLFSRQGTLMAQGFDSAAGRLTGDPVAVAPQVRFFLTTGVATFSASRSGSIVYQSQRDRARLAWVDRSGREVQRVGSTGDYLTLTLLASGRGVMFNRALQATGTYDVWALDLDRGTETRLTDDDRRTEAYPVEVAGTDDIVYGIPVGGGLQLVRQNRISGRTDVLAPRRGFQMAGGVSPDGLRLVYAERAADGNVELWTLPLADPSKAAVLRRSSASQRDPRFSPDGRYIVFVSNESGRPEAYVMSATGGVPVPISSEGAQIARWSRDGHEIVYLTPDRRLVSVPIRTSPALSIGLRVTLFGLDRHGWVDFDIASDGKRFIAIVPELIADEQPLNAILNWHGQAR